MTGRTATIALIAGLFAAGTAHAAVNVAATTDLNIRQGPGPQYPVVGVISANEQATLSGCLDSRNWCQVSHNGVSGWAYGAYLSAAAGGQPEVVTEMPAEQVPAIEFKSGTTTGAITGTVAGALIGGPVGAVIGGVVGATTGAAIDNPPAPVKTYVTQNSVEPVYLEGEVVVGAGVPDAVELRTIPDYRYQYAYVNGLPVLIDPGTRQIVYIYR